jgi:hypothetical protein
LLSHHIAAAFATTGGEQGGNVIADAHAQTSMLATPTHHG